MRWILLAGIAFLTVELSISVKVRLVGGKHRYEGRIEVFYRGVWKAVCDHRWNKKAARVVCRMLGYPDALRFTKGWHAFGRGNGKFWLDDVKCSGEEESIDKCSHRPWGWNNCLPFNQAGTVCKRHMSDLVIEPEPSISSREVRKVNIRLLGPVVDDYISEGIVQVEHKGKWGYICPSAWTPVNSFVLCGQLGFPNSEKQGSYSVALQEVEPVYWLDKVSCQGWESSIVSCLHAGFDRHQCSDTGALRIKCVRRNITKPLDVRLRSGVLVSEGRVEVQYHGFWGTVCDDHWTMKEANVVCRSLGYGSAAMATISAYYGRGMGRVMYLL